MATPKMTKEMMQEAVNMVAQHGNVGLAARKTGISVSTLRHRIKLAQEHGITADIDPSLPDFPPDDVPHSDIKELQKNSFLARTKSYEAHTWFPLKFPTNEPVMLAFIGDPHLDDDGHNVPQFQADLELCAQTKGVYGWMMGDVLNSWPSGGRLAEKWGDQLMRRKDGNNGMRELIEMFHFWKVWLIGNHENMRDTEDLIRQIAKNKDMVVHMWECRSTCVFPNGRTVFVRAAHDFKGSSWFHELHGNIRALLECPSHIVVAGHHHDHAYMRREVPQISHLINNGLPFTTHLMRVRGYKHLDKYGLIKGFNDYKEGASAAAIINPKAKTAAEFIRIEQDLEGGVDRLNWLRKR